MENTKAKPKLTQQDLRQFIGSQCYYRTMNRNVIYTEGIHYLAETGKAYWLIDDISAYFGSPKMKQAMIEDYRVREMQFWRLDVADDDSAVLTARADSTVEPFVRQEIGFTDFPLQHVDIWAGFNGEGWTLYLPSEH